MLFPVRRPSGTFTPENQKGHDLGGVSSSILAESNHSDPKSVVKQSPELQNWSGSRPAVQQLGERHGGYGVADEDYSTFARALLWTLEQSAATGEVSSNIDGVTKASSETGQSAIEVLDAARELSQLSESLGAQVDGFLTEIRQM